MAPPPEFQPVYNLLNEYTRAVKRDHRSLTLKQDRSLRGTRVSDAAAEAVAAVAAARAARGGSLEKGSADGGSGPVPAWAASEDGSAAGSAGGRPQLAPMRLGSPPR